MLALSLRKIGIVERVAPAVSIFVQPEASTLPVRNAPESTPELPTSIRPASWPEGISNENRQSGTPDAAAARAKCNIVALFPVPGRPASTTSWPPRQPPVNASSRRSPVGIPMHSPACLACCRRSRSSRVARTTSDNGAMSSGRETRSAIAVISDVAQSTTPSGSDTARAASS